MNKFEFPDCMHQMADAFHMQSIEPNNVTISLPSRDWWKLYNVITTKYSYNFMKFDGRGPEPVQFQYMGFTFKRADTLI